MSCACLSVVIITYNEECNIADCLNSVRWASEVFVVDSYSTDATVETAQSMGAIVTRHPFENCAAQWNWALDNLPFSNEWILVLDADERIPQGLAEEITRTISSPVQEHSGYYLKFKLRFMGRCLMHGGLYPTWIMRLFRRSAGRFGRHGVSEHMILDGRAGYLQNAFDHCDNKSLSDWIHKHNRYARIEAEEYLRDRLGTNHTHSIAGRFWGGQAERKHWIKLKVWNRLPLFVRPFLFFGRNYIFKRGFLDGKQGFIYHVLWSFWVRFLIDVNIFGRQMANVVGSLAKNQLAIKPLSPPAPDPCGQGEERTIGQVGTQGHPVVVQQQKSFLPK